MDTPTRPERPQSWSPPRLARLRLVLPGRTRPPQSAAADGSRRPAPIGARGEEGFRQRIADPGWCLPHSLPAQPSLASSFPPATPPPRRLPLWLHVTSKRTAPTTDPNKGARPLKAACWCWLQRQEETATRQSRAAAVLAQHGR